MNKCCEITFTLEEQHLNFIVKNSSLNFNADLGYLMGTQSYNSLADKPQINYTTLKGGNNTYEELGLEPTITDITEQDIDNLIYG